MDKVTKVVLKGEDKTKTAFGSAAKGLDRVDVKAQLLNATLIGLGSAISVGAFVSLVKNTANFNDEVAKAAARVGTTTEKISALKYAGSLADVTFEQLNTGLAKVAKTSEDFVNGSTTAVDAFGKLGIDPTQFNDTADLFAEVAEQLSKLENGSRKTAIAQEVLGKAGKELIPLMNGGRQAIADATDEAERFGLIVTEEAGKAAEEMNDNITRMEAASKGLSIEIGNRLIPDFVEATQVMIDATKQGNLLIGVLAGIGKFADIQLFGSDVEKRADKIKELAQYISHQSQTLSEASPESNKTVIDNLRQKIADAKIEMRELILLQSKPFNATLADSFGGDTTKPIDVRSGKAAKLTGEDRIQKQIAQMEILNGLVAQGVSLEDAKLIATQRQAGATDASIVKLLNLNNAKREAAAQQKTIDKEIEDAKKLQSEWMANADKARLEVNTMLAELQQNGISVQSDINAGLDAEIERLQFEVSIQHLSTEEQNKQSALRMAQLDFQAAINELMAAGVYLNEAETEALRAKYDLLAKTKGELRESNNIAQEIGLTFTSGLESAIERGGDLRDIIKGIEQDLMKMLTRKAVTEPLMKGVNSIIGDVDWGSMFGTLFNANGNAFGNQGVVPFANGGAFGDGEVLTQPTNFMFKQGSAYRHGVAGEAGNEAALPLKRLGNGKLGVHADMNVGGNGTSVAINIIGAPSRPQVNNNLDANGNGNIDVIFEMVKSDIGQDIARQGDFAQTLESTYGLNRNAGAM